MAKDPAFLFYPNDYIGGTMGMSFEEKGAYMELLMLQFNRGHMTEHMIGQAIGQLWVNVKVKFRQDDKGLYYNERLDEEQIKRKNYTKSRNNNRLGLNQYCKSGGHMTPHMENENKDVNEVEDLKALCAKFEFLNDKEFRETWDAFLEMRKSCKAKPTDKAIGLLLKKLHRQELEVAIGMLERSIENNWKGVFPLREGIENGKRKSVVAEWAAEQGVDIYENDGAGVKNLRGVLPVLPPHKRNT